MSRTNLILKIAAVAMVLMSALAFAGTPTFITLDNATDPTFNQLLGISSDGLIVGYFGSGAPDHPNKGYTLAPPYAQVDYANKNFPGSVQTQVTGISSKVTVGFWAPTNTGNDANFGWIQLANGRFMSVSNPLVGSIPAVNQLLGVNSSNIAVGFYNDNNNAPHGYLYSVQTGKFTPVNMGVSDSATGINNDGLVCGFFTNATGPTQGFVKRVSGTGTLSVTVAVPGATTTQLLGINDNGVAVGFYIDANNATHGIIYNIVTGKLTTIDAPNAFGNTTLNGINDSGQIVGFYQDAAGNFDGLLVEGAL